MSRSAALACAAIVLASAASLAGADRPSVTRPDVPVPLAGRPPATQPAAEVSGGKVHVCTTQVDGVMLRAELQFFKTGRDGQCWDAVGRDKAGHIYFGNSTHRSNSFLYRLDPATGKMRFLGDLLGNIRYGGSGGSENGKIHSSFFEGPDGGMCFTSHYGTPENIRYGGHLWKYDPKQDRIIDLGVPVPGDTSYCLSEPFGGFTYMCSTTSGTFVRYDMARQEFAAVEKTSMNFVRHTPVDSQGNLYIVWDDQIHKFDPKVGRWQTVVKNVATGPERSFGPLTAFCWNADRTRLYFVSFTTGFLFCWPVGADKVEPLGRLHPDGKDLSSYNLHLSGDGRRLFALASSRRTEKGCYMHDLVTRRSYKLFSLDAIVEHELEGKVRSQFAYIDFTDYGGVTGDDGTMYYGFTSGGRDQDLDPGGKTVVALAAFRVKEDKGDVAPASGAPTVPVQPSATPPATPKPARAEPPAAPAAPQLVAELLTGVGVVESYRMAERAQDRDATGRYPLAYWVQLRADKGVPSSRDSLLYVHVGEIDNGPDQFLPGSSINILPPARTAHEPRFGRYLLRGRCLSYRGALRPASGDGLAFVDTAVAGGSVSLVFDAAKAAKLADFAVGKLVEFEGVIEPRKEWNPPIKQEPWRQDWQLRVTLPGGEAVDIGDRSLVEHRDFRRCLAAIRHGASVKVRVVGQVLDAAPIKAKMAEVGASGTPRDVRGDVLVAVEELEVLRETAAATQPGS